ncbi:MAG: hypothetical protein KKI13_01045, partial [Candidatus Omnitrophica bacterium]|nr:hypothetical protein [Candidatus Omnitrophota bacterium]
MITQIIIRLHRLKRLFGVLLIYSIALTSVSAEEVPDASKVIIKVDSDGLRAEIIVTGRAALPEG